MLNIGLSIVIPLFSLAVLNLFQHLIRHCALLFLPLASRSETISGIRHCAILSLPLASEDAEASDVAISRIRHCKWHVVPVAISALAVNTLWNTRLPRLQKAQPRSGTTQSIFCFYLFRGSIEGVLFNPFKLKTLKQIQADKKACHSGLDPESRF